MVVLLALCIVRLWLLPLPSSFWVDEMATAFIVRYGAAHPSLAVAPQLTTSLYYLLARLAEHLFGLSEIGYRLPSILAMGIALWLVARLAARLIHPAAGLFAAIACLGLQPINYYAVDARPYALGMCMAAAALWFLVRWLDTAGWHYGLLFAGFAALVWWVHLIYWPFYLVLFLYVLARLLRIETQAGWGRTAAVFGLLGLLLLPVFIQAMSLYPEAHNHVIMPLPAVHDLIISFQLRLLLICGISALILHSVFRWRVERGGIPGSSLLLITGWWLCQPVGLFLFSYVTGNSVFLPRYLSLSLPAVALATTVVVSFLMPRAYWKPAALALAVGVLLMKGDWRHTWPIHDSNWRGAVRAINQAAAGSETPVVCLSPFIEAQWPVWRPDYQLPGFLYCHLTAYPVRGQICPFPIKTSPEAEQYAESLCRKAFPAAGRFMIYGRSRDVPMWRRWFAARPELANWRDRDLGRFEGVEAVVFERGPIPESP